MPVPPERQCDDFQNRIGHEQECASNGQPGQTVAQSLIGGEPMRSSESRAIHEYNAHHDSLVDLGLRDVEEQRAQSSRVGPRRHVKRLRKAEPFLQILPSALVHSEQGNAFVLVEIRHYDSYEQRQPDHTTEQNVNMHVEDVARAQGTLLDDVTHLQPAFQGERFEQRQERVPHVVEVKVAWVLPHAWHEHLRPGSGDAPEHVGFRERHRECSDALFFIRYVSVVAPREIVAEYLDSVAGEDEHE